MIAFEEWLVPGSDSVSVAEQMLCSVHELTTIRRAPLESASV